MRLRNVKDKEEILNNSKYVIKDPIKYYGKFKELFKNNNPIYIEIGMGKGKFIRENAINYPNINFIGIERSDSILAKFLKNTNEDIENLFVIRMNALDIDKIFLKEVDRIYLNFSDPWPKKRHHLRRLTSKVFLDKYDSIFKSNKEIYLRTDNKNLFTYSIESLSKKGYILEHVTLDLHGDNDILITTEYEDRFTNENLPIYSLEAICTVQNSKD